MKARAERELREFLNHVSCPQGSSLAHLRSLVLTLYFYRDQTISSSYLKDLDAFFQSLNQNCFNIILHFWLLIVLCQCLGSPLAPSKQFFLLSSHSTFLRKKLVACLAFGCSSNCESFTSWLSPRRTPQEFQRRTKNHS